MYTYTPFSSLRGRSIRGKGHGGANFTADWGCSFHCVFFQTLEWIALFLARVDVTCSGVLGGASMSACPVSSP